MTVAKRKAKKMRGVKKGDKYECDVCGLVVVVDKTCGCADLCDIVCCEQNMKKQRKKQTRR
jgi:hypothetical protein